MIIEHVLDMFPDEKDISFIVSKDDMNNDDYVKNLNNFSDINTVVIDFQKTGPGGALIESKLLDTEEPVLINYCDFSNIWNWQKFKDFIQVNNPDGVIPSYVGLHPHTVYGNDYAFLRTKNSNVLAIQEKKSFTTNKQNEYASTGTYYFKSGNLCQKYIKKTFEDKNFTNGEVYLSTPFQYMISDGLNIKLWKLKVFSMGNP